MYIIIYTVGKRLLTQSGYQTIRREKVQDSPSFFCTLRSKTPQFRTLLCVLWGSRNSNDVFPLRTCDDDWQQAVPSTSRWEYSTNEKPSTWHDTTFRTELRCTGELPRFCHHFAEVEGTPKYSSHSVHSQHTTTSLQNFNFLPNW